MVSGSFGLTGWLRGRTAAITLTNSLASTGFAMCPLYRLLALAGDLRVFA